MFPIPRVSTWAGHRRTMCLATYHNERRSRASSQDGRTGRMSEHKKHEEHSAGTVSGCWHCTKIAYEPSWYASLLTFSQVRDSVQIGAVQTVST